MSTYRTVIGYEFVDHGEDGESYFPGCGVAFTSFDAVFTGIGDNAQEALQDALEQSYEGDAFWPSELQAVRDEDAATYSTADIDADGNDEWHYYVSVRVKYAAQEDKQ